MTSGQLVADGYINKQHRNEPAKEYDEQFSENQSRLMRLKRISLWRAVISPPLPSLPYSTHPYAYNPLWSRTAWFFGMNHSLSHELWSGRVSERMSAAERASKASNAEQSNEWVVWTNERTDKRVAQYFGHDMWLLCVHSAIFPTLPHPPYLCT